MLCVINKDTDPFFNIALEEYLFRNFYEDYFILWLSDPSVIVGKHQNTISEINYDFVKKNDIKVVRRMSGGGAVYHDHGNLNYTFISRCSGVDHMDFEKFTNPVIKALAGMEVKARFDGKNSLMIDDMKISGNAEYIFKEKIMHHGTLLFNSNLVNLENSLKSPDNCYTDKAVKSVRSRVTNISEHLIEDLSGNKFSELIQKFFFKYFIDTSFYHLSNKDKSEVQKLADNKYRKWEWNFGRSPDYELNKELIIGKKSVRIKFTVSKGVITNFRIIDTARLDKGTSELCKAIKGLKHEESSLINGLTPFTDSLIFKRISINDFVSSLF